MADPLIKEKQAIAHLKQGNINGLHDLVCLYQVKAVHTALLIVTDRSIAEEIVQDAFLKVYEKIDQYDDNRPFAPWFFRMVINSSIKSIKKSKRELSLEDVQEVNALREWLISDSPTPESIIEHKFDSDLVLKALDQLSTDQRMAVIKRYYLEENQNEVAFEMDQPLTSVKWWLHSARKKMRSLLFPYYRDEAGSQEVQDEE